jgi:hypothetical protein
MKFCNQCHQPFFANEPWKKLCIDCWKRSRNIQPKATPGLAIEPELLKKLIYLAHPDKHGQSALSTEVSKALLTLKKGLTIS